MDTEEPNFTDEAGELHTEIIRRHAREHRHSQREMARILDDRGWPHARICEQLEINLDTLARMLAVDGLHRCTECAFGYHASCLTAEISPDGRMVQCECPVCRV